jgi:hypothetical protein
MNPDWRLTFYAADRKPSTSGFCRWQPVISERVLYSFRFDSVLERAGKKSEEASSAKIVHVHVAACGVGDPRTTRGETFARQRTTCAGVEDPRTTVSHLHDP